MSIYLELLSMCAAVRAAVGGNTPRGELLDGVRVVGHTLRSLLAVGWLQRTLRAVQGWTLRAVQGWALW